MSREFAAALSGVLAEDAHLRLQGDAGRGQHARLHLGHEGENVARGSAAEVDDEARVLFADLRVADAQALEPGVVDELCGERALGALERAARAGVFERLLFAA